MNVSRPEHLTEDQFASYIVSGTADAATAAHVAACEQCRAEVEKFGVSVQSFNLVSMAWSESRSSNSLRGQASSRSVWRLRPGLAVASWGFATGVLLMSAIPLARHFEHPSTATASVTISPQESQKQIEQDNQMLMAVDRELSAEVASPVQEYGLDKELTQGSPKGEAKAQ